jgi:hypothetical protein
MRDRSFVVIGFSCFRVDYVLVSCKVLLYAI